MRIKAYVKKIALIMGMIVCINNMVIPVYAEDITTEITTNHDIKTPIKLENANVYTKDLRKEAITFTVTIPAGQTEAIQEISLPDRGKFRAQIVSAQLNQEIKAVFYDLEETEPKVLAEGSLNINSFDLLFNANISKSGTGQLRFQMNSADTVDTVLTIKAAFYNGKSQTLSSKKWIVAGPPSEKDVLYYKINIPQNGYITVDGECYDDGNDLTVSLKDSKKQSKNPNEVTLSNKNNWTSYYAVRKGIYYLKVTDTKSLYGLCYTFTTVTDQAGSSKAKATVISAGKIKKGLVYTTDEKSKDDWFKITLSKKQKLRLTIDSRVSGALNYQIIPQSSKVKLRNSKFSPPNGICSVVTAESLPKGTYYLRITKKSIEDASGAYSIKLEK